MHAELLASASPPVNTHNAEVACLHAPLQMDMWAVRHVLAHEHTCTQASVSVMRARSSAQLSRQAHKCVHTLFSGCTRAMFTYAHGSTGTRTCAPARAPARPPPPRARARARTRRHVRVRTRRHVRVRVRVRASARACASARVRECVRARACVRACVRARARVRACVRVRAHTHAQSHKLARAHVRAFVHRLSCACSAAPHLHPM
eukprot:3158890-Pleurochrysis_carterae.AAC.1